MALRKRKGDPLAEARKGTFSRFSRLGRYRSIRHAMRKLIDNHPEVSLVSFSSMVSETESFDSSLDSEYAALSKGKISAHVEASHRRCFGGRPFDPGNEFHMAYARGSAKNAYVLTKVGEYAVKHFSPDLYLCLDGNYSVYGPIREVMQEHGVPVTIYRPDGQKDRSIYIGDKPSSVYNISSHWDDFVRNHYSPELRSRGMNFLEKRTNLNGYEPNESDTYLLDRINQTKEDYSKVIILFPNLTWDAAIKERDILFESLEDWLLKTVDWSRDNRILLIIREHPQPNGVYSPFESCFALLKELRSDIHRYEDVVFIKGSQYINSYYLASRVADCAVTYGGTLSVEIPYMGYPLVIAGNSPYSNKGVAFEPKTQEEYFSLLSVLCPVLQEFQEKKEFFRENAIRSAAYQFEYNLYLFPMMPTRGEWEKARRSRMRKYWQSWDVSSMDFTRNIEFRRTIERLLAQITKTDSRFSI